jgi:hypothetical protein
MVQRKGPIASGQSRGPQRHQYTGVNIVRFDAGVRDRLCNVGFATMTRAGERPHHRLRVADRCNYDPVFLGQGAPEAFQG